MSVDQIYAVGLEDVQVYTLDPSDGTQGSGVDLPSVANMEISGLYTEVMAEGDDQIVSTHSMPNGAEWTIESSAGMSLDALVVIYGGSATDSGSGANEATYWDFKTNVKTPYFSAIGKAIDAESDGDQHVICYKAKANAGPGSAMAYGAYKPANMSGRLLASKHLGGSDTTRLFRVINHATATDIPGTFPGAEAY